LLRNHAIAINPVDWMQQAWGIMIEKWPKVLGLDISGEVYEVGSNVKNFKNGDRVAGLAQGFLKGTPDEGAFSLYTKLPAKTAAIILSSVPFKDAAVLGTAIGTASCGLNGENYLSQPFPSIDAKSTGKVVVVYGGSSAIGSMATQLATAAGIRVISIASSKNFDFCRQCGAGEIFDYKDASVVEDVVKAVRNDTFVGVFNSISTEDSFKLTLSILEKLGGGKMATSQPPPENLPDNVKATFMNGVGEHSAPVWEHFVTKGLESVKLKCLPKPLVVGKGLESLQEALAKAKAGVSAQKIVVEL
jgi:NADPH:quinone reductase-like Zn-dependent oxidoreductase